MSKNVTLWGSSFSNVPAITVPQTGGGTARFDDCSVVTATASDVAQGKVFVANDGTVTTGTASGGGGGTWSAYGKNPTLVQTALNEKVYLKNTPFASWTPTTTTTKMSDASNLTTYTTQNFNNYDYVAVYKCHTHFEYGAGATSTAKLVDYFYSQIGFVSGHASNYENIEADTFNSSDPSNLNVSSTGVRYYNTAGSLAFFSGNSSGYFPYSYPNPSTGSSGITLKKPQMNAKCATNYFSTANASAVDMDNSYCEMKIELWQVDRGTSAYGKEIAMIHDMYVGNF